ncbi:MAG: hypothetical protein HZC47_08055 [Methanobacterium sp.]|uniref:lipid II flippase MurJ n=1 Tax=Methanobacterium sp. TaxID=2164 RepID=UPI003D65E3FC|nr:hypothetical protein [Methanobacterium sp.]
MFKFRYNLLAIFQISLLFLNTVILIRVFGASFQTDAYLIASSIIEALGLIQLMSVEQFMYFYHDLKVKSVEEAYKFYNSSLVFSIVVGIAFFAILFVGINYIIDIFAYNIDPQRYIVLKDVLIILIVGMIFNSANFVNQRLLNAEMKFSIPYILEGIFPLFILISLIYILISNNPNIEFLAYARVLGIIIAFILGLVIIKKLGIPFKLRLRHPMLKSFVKNSFSMRFGHNIHNLFFNPITTNILSSLPVGYASLFYYAQMIVIAVNSMVLGPSIRVLYSKVSNYWAEDEINLIKKSIKDYLRIYIPLFVVALILTFFIIPTALNLISSGTLSPADIELIKYIFAGLAVWYLIIMIESAFVSVGVASKNSVIFITTNTIFIIIFFSLSFLLKNDIGVFAIPIAAIIGQIINFIFYSTYGLKLLKIKIRGRNHKPKN